MHSRPRLCACTKRSSGGCPESLHACRSSLRLTIRRRRVHPLERWVRTKYDCSFSRSPSQFATSYGALGRYNDYVAKVDAALAGLSPTRDNLRLRFFAILIVVDAARLADDFDRAERGILQANAVAEQSEDAARVAELRAFTVLSEIQLARRQEDRARCAQKLQEAFSLVEELEKDPSSTREWRWFRDVLVDYFTWSKTDYS